MTVLKEAVENLDYGDVVDRLKVAVKQNGQKLIFDAKYKGKYPGFDCEGDDGIVMPYWD